MILNIEAVGRKICFFDVYKSPRFPLLDPNSTSKMSRANLLDVATRMIEWINTTAVDVSSLEKIVKKDVVVPIPYPGSTPDFQGLVDVTEKIHVASPDFKMTITDSIVDETGKVVLKTNCTGTQTGYNLPLLY